MKKTFEFLAALYFIRISFQTGNLNLHDDPENNLTPVQRTPENTIRPPFALPENMLRKPHCARNNPMPSSMESLIHSFFVQTLSLCWEYCIHVPNCRVFSYNFRELSCSLFDKDDDDNVKKGIDDFVSFSILCLECPWSLADFIDVELPFVGYTLAPGVRIADMISWSKCLSMKTPSYNTQWGSCSNSTIWILSWMQYSHFAGIRNVIRIFAKSNIDRALNSNKNNLGTAPTQPLTIDPVSKGLYLDSLVDQQIFTITPLVESKCSFCIKQLVFNYIEWGPHINFTPIAESVSVDQLSELRIWRPHKRKTVCSLEQLEVEHSKVENPGHLPFFLEDSKVRIRCDPGYVVAAVGEPPFQEVTCSKNTLVLPCTSSQSFTMKMTTITTDATTRGQTDMTSGEPDFLFFVTSHQAGHMISGQAGHMTIDKASHVTSSKAAVTSDSMCSQKRTFLILGLQVLVVTLNNF